MGTAYSEYVKVCIDYNRNGVFTDAGGLVVNAAASRAATTRTGSFTVPTTAKSGNTRLRVVLSDNSATTSCGSYLRVCGLRGAEVRGLVLAGGQAARRGRAPAAAGCMPGRLIETSPSRPRHNLFLTAAVSQTPLASPL